MSAKCICCANSFDLGCKAACGTFELPIVAQQEGDHVIQWEFNQIVFKNILVDLNIADPIVIDLSLFNELSTNHFKVIQPDGTEYIYSFGGTDYDCFKIKLEPVNVV